MPGLSGLPGSAHGSDSGAGTVSRVRPHPPLLSTRAFGPGMQSQPPACPGAAVPGESVRHGRRAGAGVLAGCLHVLGMAPPGPAVTVRFRSARGGPCLLREAGLSFGHVLRGVP